MPLSADEVARKNQWRSKLLAERDATTEAERDEQARLLRDAVLREVAETGVTAVAAYVPVGTEPGSLELLDSLRQRGIRVLLPVVVRSNPLDWADYDGPDSLERAGYGLLEPRGRRLGPEAIADADLVLVPGLAVDRSGVRLGRGAGFYDRSLPFASNSARLIAVVGESEFVDSLPGEEHDVRVHAVLTPERGTLELPR